MEREPDLPRIQIESKDDVAFLQGQVRKSLKEALVRNPTFRALALRVKNNEATEEEVRGLKEMAQEVEEYIEAWSNELWRLAGPNISINGMPYEEVMKERDQYEPLDEKLKEQVKDLEAEADELLLRVTEHRRTVPQLVERLESDRIRRLSMLAERTEIDTLDNVKDLIDANGELSVGRDWELPERLGPELEQTLSLLQSSLRDMPEALSKVQAATQTVDKLQQFATASAGDSRLKGELIDALGHKARLWDEQALDQRQLDAAARQLERVFEGLMPPPSPPETA
ncbi:hypothetical protein EV182_005409, partial [Spiromyces aspiralis]